MIEQIGQIMDSTLDPAVIEVIEQTIAGQSSIMILSCPSYGWPFPSLIPTVVAFPKFMHTNSCCYEVAIVGQVRGK